MKTLLLFVAIALSINVFGQDIKTVKIGNLEVMTEDLGHMNWEDAKKACADLGDGWRLPSKDELDVLCENKDEIGGFGDDWYWSSKEGKENGYDLYEDVADGAWVQLFEVGSYLQYY